ncbi:MAG: beta-lactamase family protein, partial [Gemmatimonadota bacterium]|nr:beta-lactamase family protein [Gemmatimonadota bacterium]
DTVPVTRAITLRDLMTMRMGLGAIMEAPGTYPIQRAMAKVELAPSADIFSHSPDEFMKRLGTLPLVHQPGERWLYHTGMDVAGVLVAAERGGGES